MSLDQILGWILEEINDGRTHTSRTERKALDLIQGTEKDQYEKLWDYMHEVVRANLGNTMLIQMVIDGTFLKGPCWGVLLTAVGMDPNYSIYPIAYAITEGENKDTWEWFALWATVKATTPAQFASKMEEMTEIDLDAAKWFDDKPAAQWSRNHFSIFPRCDVLLSNIFESFNSKILYAREMSIIDGDQLSINLNDITGACRKLDLTAATRWRHTLSAMWEQNFQSMVRLIGRRQRLYHHFHLLMEERLEGQRN
ncbi:hypothetical protein ACH5RR_036912 [Cinchona calisaya]|uniref:MULE transposase domain-containing protein n=1 Tax=Cinchona calisaya TaxID=153742 RepID=A0ABD2Y5V8_9GENT